MAPAESYADADVDARCKRVKSAIAMRIAYSVFVAHKPEMDFTSFREVWTSMPKAPPLHLVTNKVQECIGKDRHLLLIVDDAIKTNFPKYVRRCMHVSCLTDDIHARMVMSCPRTSVLDREQYSSFHLRWVPMSRGDPQQLHSILRTFEWRDNALGTTTSNNSDAPAASSASNSATTTTVTFAPPPPPHRKAQKKALSLYLLSCVGNNWRARTELSRVILKAANGSGSTAAMLRSPVRGVRSALEHVGKHFEFEGEWEQAVNNLLVLTVLKIRVSLVPPSPYRSHLFFSSRPHLWLHKGLLCNSEYVDHAHSSLACDVPVIPMIVLHKWLACAHEENRRSNAPALETLVRQMWKHVQNVQVARAHSPVRFAHLMASWLSLVLYCAVTFKCRKIRLCAIPKGDYSVNRTYPRLFPSFDIVNAPPLADITFDVPETIDSMSRIVTNNFGYHSSCDVVQHLDFIICKQEDGDGIDPRTPRRPHHSHRSKLLDTVFVCKAEEPAVDLLLYLGGKLVLIQCRLYEGPMARELLDQDLKNLTVFRNRLWNVDAKATTVPRVAHELNLPAIAEEDVVFVVLSPHGLAAADPHSGRVHDD